MKNSEIHAVHSHYRRPQRKKTPLWKKLFMALVVIMVICVAGAGAGFLLSITGTLPDVSQTLSPAASSQIYDCKGRLITTVHAEQNRLPEPGIRPDLAVAGPSAVPELPAAVP